MQRFPKFTKVLTSVLAALLLVVAPACGGGGGGAGPDGAGQGLVLISFLQNGVGNLSLNQILEFRFSEAVDPATVTVASLQVREGPSYGRAVDGNLRVVGSTVYFEPTLPGNCDLSDSGFKPDLQYRVTLVGYPEQFSIKNTQGQPLSNTQNFEFHTRPENDALLFIDQIAGSPPQVTASTPQNGTPVVYVETNPNLTNEIVIQLTENISPCTVSDSTVRLYEYQRGDPTRFLTDAATGRKSGFNPIADADVANPFSWGPLDAGETNLAPNPQRIRTNLVLEQTFSETVLRITPEFGQFPENALIVLEMTFGMRDFGNNSLVPFTLSFTTENRTGLSGTYAVTFTRPDPLAEVDSPPIIQAGTNADVETDRSPNRAQGWLIFSGDGDNGSNQLQASGPNQPPDCLLPLQPNNGTLDDFDPTTDVNLDTGLTPSTCPNGTDGTSAVTFEFNSFRIRGGRTVRVVGINPAIFLVKGLAQIDAGGRLLGRGDGIGGTGNANGTNGSNTQTDPPGGRGYAGGGSGGNAYKPTTTNNYGDSGASGFGSPSGYGVVGGTGAGLGGAHAVTSSFTNNGSSNGGGGGGHSIAGTSGGSATYGSMVFKAAAMGNGGVTYPNVAQANRMRTPSAGSGGGASGYFDFNSSSYNTYWNYKATGAGGGAGGGFLDITAATGIVIAGEVNVAGGKGGNGGSGFSGGSGGAGGGSGGGIRLLTPADINISGAVLTAAGGGAGTGQKGTYDITYGYGGTPNSGGAGGVGRIAMEDGDSIISGQAGVLTMIPNEGDPGFYRGTFDATRFVAGLNPVVLSDVFFISPANPAFQSPVAADFLASIPAGSERLPGQTAILIEARGYNILPDGSPDLGTGTGWYTVGYFANSGVSSAPTWNAGVNPLPADVPTLPAGNVGAGIGNVNGREFLQLRITFYLPQTIGAFDPGPILDDWTVRFTYDQ